MAAPQNASRLLFLVAFKGITCSTYKNSWELAEFFFLPISLYPWINPLGFYGLYSKTCRKEKNGLSVSRFLFGVVSLPALPLKVSVLPSEARLSDCHPRERSKVGTSLRLPGSLWAVHAGPGLSPAVLATPCRLGRRYRPGHRGWAGMWAWVDWISEGLSVAQPRSGFFKLKVARTWPYSQGPRPGFTQPCPPPMALPSIH